MKMFGKKKNIKYDFKDFNAGVSSIVNNIEATGAKYSRIVGLTRGGLVLAARLAYILDLPITTITWSTRDTGEKEWNETIPEDMNAGQSILLVDDIIDSGETIKQLTESWGHYPTDNLSIACLYLNTAQDIMPDYFHKTIDREKDKTWIEFWWEDANVL